MSVPSRSIVLVGRKPRAPSTSRIRSAVSRRAFGAEVAPIARPPDSTSPERGLAGGDAPHEPATEVHVCRQRVAARLRVRVDRPRVARAPLGRRRARGRSTPPLRGDRGARGRRCDAARALSRARRCSPDVEARPTREEPRSGGLCEHVTGDRRNVHPFPEFSHSLDCANQSTRVLRWFAHSDCANSSGKRSAWRT